MTTIYYTGCSLDGFIAAPGHSLDWLLEDVQRNRDFGCAKHCVVRPETMAE